MRITSDKENSKRLTTKLIRFVFIFDTKCFKLKMLCIIFHLFIFPIHKMLTFYFCFLLIFICKKKKPWMNCNLLMFYFIVACRCLQRLLVPKQPRTQEDGLRLQICWILFQLLFLSSLIFQQNCDGKILHQILVSFKIGKKILISSLCMKFF